MLLWPVLLPGRNMGHFILLLRREPHLWTEPILYNSDFHIWSKRWSLSRSRSTRYVLCNIGQSTAEIVKLRDVREKIHRPRKTAPIMLSQTLLDICSFVTDTGLTEIGRIRRRSPISSNNRQASSTTTNVTPRCISMNLYSFVCYTTHIKILPPCFSTR